MRLHNNGLGIGTVLFLIFLVLKLTGHVAWSWWWVSSPLWLPLLVILGLFGTGIILTIIGFLIKEFINYLIRRK